MTTYLLAGGGTAGHVNPLLATADRLAGPRAGCRDPRPGTAEGLEARLVPERGYQLLTVARLPFPRRPNRDALRFPAAGAPPSRATRALHAGARESMSWSASAGYAAAPAYVAARARGGCRSSSTSRTPGRASPTGSAPSSRAFVGVTFPGTRLRGGRIVGLPLRREIADLDRLAARPEGSRVFGLDPARPVLLVTGGSTGARQLNASVSVAVSRAARQRMAGAPHHGDRARLSTTRASPATGSSSTATGWISPSRSPIWRSRAAGATTVSELAALGIPAVFVPLRGRQRRAGAQRPRAPSRRGGAILVRDADFDPRSTSSPNCRVLLRDPRHAWPHMAARIVASGPIGRRRSHGRPRAPAARPTVASGIR